MGTNRTFCSSWCTFKLGNNKQLRSRKLARHKWESVTLIAVWCALHNDRCLSSWRLFTTSRTVTLTLHIHSCLGLFFVSSSCRILWSTPLAILAYFLIWYVPPFENGKVIWYLFFYCLFQTLQTVRVTTAYVQIMNTLDLRQIKIFN